jgi:Secretion system C-terminal sorting domain
MKKIFSVLMVAFFATALVSVTAWGGTVTTVGSGNWSSTTPGAPWSGGTLPQTTDDVVIADGCTVTIDQGVTVNSLTVGQGTSGTLTFSGTTPRAVIVTTDITIAIGGTFVTQTAGTATNTMSIGGNLTNNGTFDMSQGGTTFLCTVTFNKAGNQTISGSGTTTRFRFIILNKSAVGNKVTASTNVTVGPSSAITFTNGTWEQSAGTLTTGGTFTVAATGAMIIDGTGSYTTPITSSGGSTTINGALTVNTSGSFTSGGGNNTLAIASGATATFTSGTINVNGTFRNQGTTTINGGTFNIELQAAANNGAGFHGFEISSAGNLTMNNGTITIVDPLIATGIGHEIYIKSSGTVAFNGGTINLGDGSSTKTGADGFEVVDSSFVPLNNLTIQTGGISGRNVTLIAPLSVNGTLTLTSGNIALGGYTLTLGTAIAFPGTLSYTAGYLTGAGTFTRWFANGAISGNAGLFPMGVGTNNRSLAIGGSPSTGGPVAVSYNDASTVSSIAISENTQNFVNRYDANWVVTPSGGYTDPAMTLTIHGDGIPGITSVADLDLSGATVIATGVWAAPSGSTSAPVLTRNGLTQGTIVTNPFYIASTNTSPLPVEIASFTALAGKNSVELAWNTATEVNNYGFDIERAIHSGLNGLGDWAKVGFVSGNGNSNAPHNYSFTDNSVMFGTYSYRLKQIDRNGNFEYSKEVEAAVTMTPNTMVLGQNYPNPFNPETNIEFAVPVSGYTTLKVYNTLGEEITTLVNENIEAGVSHQVTFKGSNFPSGIYFYTLRSGSFVETKKMLMVK